MRFLMLKESKVNDETVGTPLQELWNNKIAQWLEKVRCGNCSDQIPFMIFRRSWVRLKFYV